MKLALNKRVMRLSLCLLGLAPLASNASAFAAPFTLPVLPDTQVAVNFKPEMFTSQMKWLAANGKAMNMPIVLHVGDIVDYNNAKQWERASDGFKILDEAKLPYALAVGNHDTAAVGENSGSAAPGDTHLNVRSTNYFNSFFPVERLSAEKGQYEPGKSDNAYYLFEAGGLKWLVVTLEFCARPEPVNWAGKVLSAFPNRNAIILTHYHLTSQGNILPNNGGYGDMNAQAIYDQIMKTHSNLLMVICGHVGLSAHREDKGEAGNIIYQILQDYQGQDAGGGYIRLLDVDPEAGTISARMYSPFHNKTLDDTSKFTLTGVKFIK